MWINYQLTEDENKSTRFPLWNGGDCSKNLFEYNLMKMGAIAQNAILSHDTALTNRTRPGITQTKKIIEKNTINKTKMKFGYYKEKKQHQR